MRYNCRMRHVLGVTVVIVVSLVLVYLVYDPLEIKPIMPDKPLLHYVNNPESYENIVRRKPSLAEIVGIAIQNNGHQWHGFDVICNNTEEIFASTKLFTPNGVTPIFMYHPDHDRRVSKSLMETGSWQPRVLLEVLDMMEENDRIVFVDIGAGIGAFSLAAAKMHRFVMAVEPAPDNARRLCEGIVQGKFQRRVFLICNALAEERKPMELQIWDDERSDARLLELRPLSNNIQVTAVCLDDLIRRFPYQEAAIRIDARENVANILRGAVHFFNVIDVRSVMVTWREISGSGAQYVQSFMERHGLKPFGRANGKIPLFGKDFKDWPPLVIFKKTRKYPTGVVRFNGSKSVWNRVEKAFLTQRSNQR